MHKLGKDKINYVRSLYKKKYRQKYNKFYLEGYKIIHEIPLRYKPLVDIIYCSDLEILEKLKAQYGKLVFQIDPISMRAISNLSTPPGCLAIMNLIAFDSASQIQYIGRSMYLDGLSDPGNVGTIIRTASYLGISRIILSPHTVDIFNPKLIQATMGAIWHTEIHSFPLDDIPHEVPIFGADMKGHSYLEFEFPDSFVIIIGNEANGINPLSRKRVQDYIMIPNKNDNRVESLNAAMAAGILMAHICSR